MEPDNNKAKTMRYGNKGVITTKLDEKMKQCTSHLAAYRVPTYCCARIKGARVKLIEKTIRAKVREEMDREEIVEPEPKKGYYDTVYNNVYGREGFVPTMPEPTQPHDVNTEMSISYWSEHADRIHGVSEINRKHDSFKKSARFTEPTYDNYEDPLHIDANNTL